MMSRDLEQGAAEHESAQPVPQNRHVKFYFDALERINKTPGFFDRTKIDLVQKMIGAMHLRNVQYQESKVLMHYLILQVGETEVGRPDDAALLSEKFKPLCTVARMDQIHDDLAHYTTALQNYRTWKETCRGTSTSTSISQSINLALLQTEGQNGVPNGVLSRADFDLLRQTIITDYSAASPSSKAPITSHVSGSLAANTAEDLAALQYPQFRSRLSFAIFGGLTLIAPMFIMTLHTTKITALTTASLFVFFIAIIVAWRMKDAQNKDILAVTAAYAAVLVVFVGTVMAQPATGTSA